MFKGKVLLFSLMLVLATSVYAGDIDDCESDAGVSCVGMQVNICPQGDFEWIYAGCGGASDYIWIFARDAAGLGVAGVPFTDFWLNSCDPAKALCLCTSPVASDSLTNALGRTTISGRIAGGLCNVYMDGTTQGIYVAVQGKIIKGNKPNCDINLCLAIKIKSPDLVFSAGLPCIVNLSDLGVFGNSYNKQPPNVYYNPCCDYNDDNKCNLSDFAFFSSHYNHRCL
jgi:hypothetical protein